MGQIGQTIGGLVGIGQNPGLNTFGASEYGQDYSALISQQQGNLNAVNANQSALASQLGNIASGQGPNVAQNTLNQATSQNVANQGALAAGQRGAAQNVGLIQRQTAQQGMQAQQQAAGQGATMRANQQLGALGQQAGVYGQQGQQANSAMGAYEAAINSANQVNAGSAESRAKYGQGFGGGLLTGIGSMLAEGGEIKMAGGGDYVSSMPATGGGGGNNSFVSQFLSGSSANSGQAGYGKKNTGLVRSILNNLGQANKSDPAAGSQSLGSSSTYNQNLTPMGNNMAGSPGAASGNAGYAGADMGAADASGAGAGSAAGMDAAADEGGASGISALLAAKGGKVPAMVSKGEHILNENQAKAAAGGKVNPLKVGETVPGKPKYKGNNYANDVVRKDLPEGGVVIPNSVMQSKNPERGAAEFVAAVLAKKRTKR